MCCRNRTCGCENEVSSCAEEISSQVVEERTCCRRHERSLCEILRGCMCGCHRLRENCHHSCHRCCK